MKMSSESNKIADDRSPTVYLIGFIIYLDAVLITCIIQILIFNSLI